MLPGAAYSQKNTLKKEFFSSFRPDSTTIWIYLSFAGACSFVWQALRKRRGLSTLPTFSVWLQVLAMAFLERKIMKTRNAGGISAKTLTLQAIVCSLRLCCTLWLRGYLPTDASGEWFYQLGDIVSLGICLHLLYSVRETYRYSYQVDSDSFLVWPIVIVCVILAILIHPDLNNRVIFDTIWASALYIDVVAMLPQLWMLSKIGGNVEALTGNYVATVALSRMVNFGFWYWGYKELAPLDGSFNSAGIMVLLAHVTQGLLMCDFMYYYMRAKFGILGGGPISL